MPALTIARARATDIGLPPSSLTASAPASLTTRIAVVMACSSEISYEPNGRSTMRNGVLSPRRAARARTSISSSSTATVDG